MIATITLVALGAAVSLLGRPFGSIRGLTSFISLIILTFAVYFIIRFAISEYSYEIADGVLIIKKKTGQRKNTVASLDLSTGYGVCRRPKTPEEKADFQSRFGNTDGRMNFCRNLFAQQYVYVTEFNGKKYELLLEIDEFFASELEKAIDSSKPNASSDDF